MCAQCLTQQGKHDDDAREAGHHQQCRRQERQAGEQDQRLYGQGIVLATASCGLAADNAQATGLGRVAYQGQD